MTSSAESGAASVPFVIRPAAASDAAAVRDLLKASDLPLDGVPDTLEHFLVARSSTDDALLGVIGLELQGDAALLRSAAVRADLRGTGVGAALVRALLDRAREQHVKTVVLLTTTAERWFPRFGFEPSTRDQVPEALKVSEEFRGACPASAHVMGLALGARA